MGQTSKATKDGQSAVLLCIRSLIDSMTENRAGFYIAPDDFYWNGVTALVKAYGNRSTRKVDQDSYTSRASIDIALPPNERNEGGKFLLQYNRNVRSPKPGGVLYINKL